MTFRSFFDRSQRRRQLRRANHGHASRRPRFEALEDRSLLSLTPAVSYSVGTEPQAVVAADFNKDGRLDLVTSNPSDFTISLLIGDGQGGFGAAAHFDAWPTATDPPWVADYTERDASLVIADFNEDGKLDVATVHRYRDPDTGHGYGYLSLLLGNGDGTFQTATGLDSGTEAAAGDFNGDGNVDLLVGADDWDDSLGQLRVLRGNGRGGFTKGPDEWLDYPPDAVGARDINGDGKLDAILLAGNIWTLLGNGDGTFGHMDEIGMSPGGLDLALLEGFGLVVVGETISIPSDHAPNGSMHTGVASGDFNGDGKPDVVTSDGDTGTVSLLLGNGDGTVRYIGAFAAGSSPSAVAVGDFNGDGRPDVATANAGSNTVSVLLNDGSWSNAMAPGDGDGDQDVDGADFLLWQRTLGGAVIPSGSGADWNTSGQIDAADLGFWKANFGDAPAPPAQESAARAAVRTLVNDEEGVHGEAPAATVPFGEPYALPAASRSRPAVRSPVFGVFDTRDRAIERRADAALAAPALQRVAMAARLSPLSQADHDRDDDRLSLLSEDQADYDADSFRVAADQVFCRLGTRDQEVWLRH